MKSKKVLYVILMSLVIGVVLISENIYQRKKNTAEVSSNKKQSAQTLKGISLSPKSFQAEDFTDFFEKAKQIGDVVTWAGDWDELANTQSGGPTVVASLSSKYDYIPIIQAQFFTQSTGKLLRPLNDATKQRYKDSAIAFAEKYKPEYLGFGIEVNMLYEKSPADFDVFSQFFGEVYDAIKIKSPNTKVFTVFQLEKMKGLSGGVFGGKNDLKKSQWFLLEKFPKSDIAAFTTYPGLIYKNPSDIPSDYYSEIKSHTSKPVAFTEIGWHSAASPAGWESSEEEQAEFVDAFFNLTKDMKKQFNIWSFLFDQNTAEPFKTMGLRGSDGNGKLSWDRWRLAE